MIIYVCNRCKRTIELRKNVILVQTKVGEETSTSHLCRECHNHIKGLCIADIKKVVNPSKTELSDGGAIIKNMIKSAEAAEEVKEESKSGFNIDVMSFNPEMESVPRMSVVPAFQRVLLAVYKGMSPTEISNIVGKSYQEVYRIKSKYSCCRIAEKHLLPERMDEKTVAIIDSFIRSGDVEETALRAKCSVDEVRDILSEYTGLYQEERTSKKEVDPELAGLNFPIKVDDFPDDIMRKPRATTLDATRRIVLCLYKGMSLADTARAVGKTSQDVYRIRSCYTSKEVAQRHLQPERMEFDVTSVIDTYIKFGDVCLTYVDLSLTEDEVRKVLDYYTGL